MTKCKLCHHPQRNEIERSVAVQQMTYVAAADVVGCSDMSIHRHMQNHVHEKVRRAADQLDISEGLAVIDALQLWTDRIEHLYTASAGVHETLEVVNTAIRLLGLKAKVVGVDQSTEKGFDWDDPRYLELQDAVLNALDSDARVKLSEELTRRARERSE